MAPFTKTTEDGVISRRTRPATESPSRTVTVSPVSPRRTRAERRSAFGCHAVRTTVTSGSPAGAMRFTSGLGLGSAGREDALDRADAPAGSVAELAVDADGEPSAEGAGARVEEPVGDGTADTACSSRVRRAGAAATALVAEWPDWVSSFLAAIDAAGLVGSGLAAIGTAGLVGSRFAAIGAAGLVGSGLAAIGAAGFGDDGAGGVGAVVAEGGAGAGFAATGSEATGTLARADDGGDGDWAGTVA